MAANGATGKSLGKRPRSMLGDLDPNKDLNTPRGLSKRRPIAFGQENTEALHLGLARGTYNLRDVISIDHRDTDLPAPGYSDDQEEEAVPEDTFTPGQRAQVHGMATGELLDDEGEEDFGDDLMDDDLDEDFMEEGEGVDEQTEAEEHMQEPVFDPAAVGLKEINNLAHFGVSSHKPGNGVAELLSDDLDKYWQSDGQQPHLLTIHFLRRVEIRAIRFYVDYAQDESYTPTHILFLAGTGHHDLIQFADMSLANPAGWQDVPVGECGGGADGRSLCCHIVQVHVKENHQNGKDTHLRGIKIFALDETTTTAAAAGGPGGGAGAGGGVAGDSVSQMEEHINQAAGRAIGGIGSDEHEIWHLLDELDAVDGDGARGGGGSVFSGVPEYMRDPEIR